MYEKLEVHVTGVAPGLMMHNPRTADHLDPFSKELKRYTNIRKKTDEHYLEMSKLEFLAGLYTDTPLSPAVANGSNTDAVPIIPAKYFMGVLIEVGKKQRLGKTIKSSILVEEDCYFKYEKPKNIKDRMLNEACYVREIVTVNGKKVIRTRPLFREWSCDATILVDSSELNVQQVFEMLKVAGRRCGLGDYRPTYGRFNVELING